MPKRVAQLFLLFVLICSLPFPGYGIDYVPENMHAKIDALFSKVPPKFKAEVNWAKMNYLEKYNYLVSTVPAKVRGEVMKKSRDKLADKMIAYSAALFRKKIFIERIRSKLVNRAIGIEKVDWSRFNNEIGSEADTFARGLSATFKVAKIGWDVYQSIATGQKGEFKNPAAVALLGTYDLMADVAIPGWGWFKLGKLGVEVLGQYILDTANSSALSGMLERMYGIEEDPVQFAKMLINKSPSQIEAMVESDFNDMAWGFVFEGQATKKGESDMKEKLVASLVGIRGNILIKIKEQNKKSPLEEMLETRVKEYDSEIKRSVNEINKIAIDSVNQADHILKDITGLSENVHTYVVEDLNDKAGKLAKEAVDCPYPKLNISSIVSSYINYKDANLLWIGSDNASLPSVYDKNTGESHPVGSEYQEYLRMYNQYLKTKATILETHNAEVQKVHDALYKQQGELVNRIMAQAHEIASHKDHGDDEQEFDRLMGSIGGDPYPAKMYALMTYNNVDSLKLQAKMIEVDHEYEVREKELYEQNRKEFEEHELAIRELFSSIKLKMKRAIAGLDYMQYAQKYFDVVSESSIEKIKYQRNPGDLYRKYAGGYNSYYLKYREFLRDEIKYKEAYRKALKGAKQYDRDVQSFQQTAKNLFGRDHVTVEANNGKPYEIYCTSKRAPAVRYVVLHDIDRFEPLLSMLNYYTPENIFSEERKAALDNAARRLDAYVSYDLAARNIVETGEKLKTRLARFVLMGISEKEIVNDAIGEFLVEMDMPIEKTDAFKFLSEMKEAWKANRQAISELKKLGETYKSEIHYSQNSPENFIGLVPDLLKIEDRIKAFESVLNLREPSLKDQVLKKVLTGWIDVYKRNHSNISELERIRNIVLEIEKKTTSPGLVFYQMIASEVIDFRKQLDKSLEDLTGISPAEVGSDHIENGGPTDSANVSRTSNGFSMEAQKNRIQKFYEDFASAYQEKNLSLLISYLSEDWGSQSDATSLSDLEDYLRNSFTVFDEISYQISDMAIQKGTKAGEYKVMYNLLIKGYIYDDDITHEEKSSVIEMIYIKGAKIRLAKTLNGRFWYVK